MFCQRKLVICFIGTFASLLHLTGGTRVDCITGNLYKGTTCLTFFKCVKGRFFNHMLEFNCPPGTSFDSKISLCTDDRFLMCADNKPHPPSGLPEQSVDKTPPSSGVNPQGAPGLVGPPGSLGGTGLHPPPSSSPSIQGAPGIAGPPGSTGDTGSRPSPCVADSIGAPGVLGPPATSDSLNCTPGTNEPGACVQYELDQESDYKCPSTGIFSAPGQCNKFFLCMNTMGCIVKGFTVNCPPEYLFSEQRQQCIDQRRTSPCPYLQDQGIGVEKEKPTIQLTKSNMKSFFKVKGYWDLKQFLPKTPEQNLQDERTFPLQPADVAKGASKTRFSWKRILG